MRAELTSVQGRVMRIDDYQATVDVDAVNVCPRCASGKGCGAGLYGSSDKPARISIRLPQQSRIRTGDVVTLSIAPHRLLYASCFAYGLPLLGAVAGLLFGQVFMQPVTDGKGVVLALLGMAAGFLFGQRRLRQASCMQQFVPELTGRVNAP